MSQCRHGNNQQNRCAECTRAMAPAHEALKAAMRSGVDLFAPSDVDGHFVRVMDERDRFREALESIAACHPDFIGKQAHRIATEALGGLP